MREEEGLLTPCREKSLTSAVRRILAMGDMDVVEERVTHAPAEDRDMSHQFSNGDSPSR